MTGKNKKTIIKAFMGVSVLALIAYLGYCLLTAVIGFTFFFTTSYGIDAVLGSLTVLGYLYWPALVPAVLILIGGTIYLRRHKD